MIGTERGALLVCAAIVLRPRPELLNRRLVTGYYRYDADGVLEKRCAACRDYWPADSAFFFANRGEHDGLHCHCKACYIERRYGDRTTSPHH